MQLARTLGANTIICLDSCVVIRAFSGSSNQKVPSLSESGTRIPNVRIRCVIDKQVFISGRFYAVKFFSLVLSAWRQLMPRVSRYNERHIWLFLTRRTLTSLLVTLWRLWCFPSKLSRALFGVINHRTDLNFLSTAFVCKPFSITLYLRKAVAAGKSPGSVGPEFLRRGT